MLLGSAWPMRRQWVRRLSLLSTQQTFRELGCFSKDDIDAFIHITGDINPIHVDSSAATGAGFPGTIVPGILTASLFPSVISKHFPGAIYMSQTLKFRNYGLVCMHMDPRLLLVRYQSTIHTCMCVGGGDV